MFRKSSLTLAFTAFALVACVAVNRDAQPLHGNDVAGNWDPDAASITIDPTFAINPVRTQHVVIATVSNADGEPLGGRRVEWMIPQGSLGSIVDVDQHGVYSSDGSLDDNGFHRALRGEKVDNGYAVTHTNDRTEVLDMGTESEDDDVVVGPGQTWIAITSTSEGTTDVVAYAPGIDSWNDHKAYATKKWMDVDWQWPKDASNRVGEDHVFSTLVVKYSDKSPLSGYEVTYSIESGPAGAFEESGESSVTVLTDENGIASATLQQSQPAEGRNVVGIMVMKPANEACCEPSEYIAAGEVTKTWFAPSIAITKDAPAQVAVGENFQYAIVVSNEAQVSTRQTVVTDALPDGIEYVSSTPAAQASGQNLTWDLGAIQPGGSRSIAVTVRATRTGTFENCADVNAEAGLSDRDCAVTRAVAPALQLDKSAPAEVMLCETIPYRFVVRNSGDGAATNVRIRDQLPQGLVLEGGGRNVDIDVGTLEAGQSREFTVNAQANRTGDYANTASATADGGLSAEDNASVTVRQPVLTITKTATERAFIGRPISYEITVTNTGDAPSRNTVLVDTLPQGVTFRTASDGGSHAGGRVTWNLGTMAPDASRTVTITVGSGGAAGTLVNRAAVQGDCAAEVTAQARTVVEGIPALLLEVVDIQDPIEVGAQEVYEITVTNQGSAESRNIQIVATMPAEQSFVNATGPASHSVANRTITFAPVASLAPKAEITYRITVQAEAAGDVRFAVALTSAMLTTPVNETEATRQY